MARRPLGHLYDLPRGAGGSHFRAAMEKALPTSKLLRIAAEVPQKFPALRMFSGAGFWNWLKDYSVGAPESRAAFPPPGDASIREMSEEASIALLGDWGTGTDEAECIASLVRAQKPQPQYTIHIGDVYYVGSEQFIDENCRGKKTTGYEGVNWPVGTHGSFAMNGNHEAYARDGAYFRWIRDDLHQPSSCFALHNENWCVLGLDTGYNSEGIPWIGWIAEHYGWKWLMPSCKLPDPVMVWLKTNLQPYLNQHRGLILLTHHQPCSAFENEYLKPASQIASIPGLAGRTLLWLWGHEHRLALYDGHSIENMQVFGRCIGHGGMPVEIGGPVDGREDRCLAYYDDRSYTPQAVNRDDAKDRSQFGVNGFATLLLQGATATITYTDISGAAIASEKWQVHQGSVVPKQPTTFGTTVQVDGKRIVAAEAVHAHCLGMR